jgi:hypothetical protein
MKRILNAVIYGSYLGVTAVALALILYFTGFESSSPGDVSKVGLLPINLILIYLAIRNRKKNELDGKISFLECFKTGMIVALIGGTIMTVFTYLWYTFNSELLMRMAQNTIQKLKFKQLTQNQIRIIIKNIQTYTPGIAALAVFEANLMISLVVSLLLSIFIRSKNKIEPETMNIAA